VSTVTPLPTVDMFPRGCRGCRAPEGNRMPQYKVNVGIDYAGRRAEPGDIIDDLPARSVKWLLEQGIVEETTNPEPKTKSEPPKSPKPKSKGDDD